MISIRFGKICTIAKISYKIIGPSSCLFNPHSNAVRKLKLFLLFRRGNLGSEKGHGPCPRSHVGNGFALERPAPAHRPHCLLELRPQVHMLHGAPCVLRGCLYSILSPGLPELMILKRRKGTPIIATHRNGC